MYVKVNMQSYKGQQSDNAKCTGKNFSTKLIFFYAITDLLLMREINDIGGKYGKY